jgi:hypothetical protein
MNNKFLLTKDEFMRLYDEYISKKDYDNIIYKITHRVREIVLTMVKPHTNRFWWDFDNCNYDSDNSDGFFDPAKYREGIGIGGENVNFPEPYDCDPGFPTRWLWDAEFEKEFKKEVEKYKEEEASAKANAKEKARKLYRASLAEQIKAKLTPEELKIVKFKT